MSFLIMNFLKLTCKKIHASLIRRETGEIVINAQNGEFSKQSPRSVLNLIQIKFSLEERFLRDIS